MFLIKRKFEAGIVLKFSAFWGSCSYKFVLINWIELSVAAGAECIVKSSEKFVHRGSLTSIRRIATRNTLWYPSPQSSTTLMRCGAETGMRLHSPWLYRPEWLVPGRADTWPAFSCAGAPQSSLVGNGRGGHVILLVCNLRGQCGWCRWGAWRWGRSRTLRVVLRRRACRCGSEGVDGWPFQTFQTLQLLGAT